MKPEHRLWLRRMAWVLGSGLLMLVIAAVVLAMVLFQSLRAVSGEWSRTVRLGGFESDLSMPALIRLATHPLGLRWIDGHDLKTRIGTLHWTLAEDGETLQGRCVPCMLDLPELSRVPVQWASAEFTVHRWAQSDFQGTLKVGDGAQALRGTWKARLESKGMRLNVALAEAPIAHYYATFADAIPEYKTARIDGRARFDIQVDLPDGAVHIKPLLTGFRVEGLGTEAWAEALPPQAAACKPQTSDFGKTMLLAVIAAEDQRFAQHPGYDLLELEAALRRNQQEQQIERGGSTLTQQLAKMLYTGDERTHARKLRELLYAVEMERTLGKLRILQLYLSMAPWGRGQCGAQAAARHYLRKRANALTPVEAAWLASLLRSPEPQIARWRDSGQVDVARVTQVLNGWRPGTPAWRRSQIETLATWTPPPYKEGDAASPSSQAGRASGGKSSQRRTK